MSVLDRVLDKARATVPMDKQVQGLRLAQKAKRLVLGERQPTFVEDVIPDVDGLDLTEIDVSNPFLYGQGKYDSYFARLRDEAPVHYQAHSAFGPYWSVTRYADILAVDKDFETFSAEPQIVIGTPPEGLDVEMFIAMDPPRHDRQRDAVQGVVSPRNLEEMEGLIRSRVQEVLDELPVDEPFDWVDKVSIELTSRMLATLLDFPYEQRRKLVYWTELAAASASATGGSNDMDEVYRGVADMARSFSELWHDKAARLAAGEKPGYDLITLMQMSEDTKDLIERPMEFLGNLTLLIVGGNDTTRNSMTGGVYALNQFPDQFDRLRSDHGLVPKLVNEIIRWQTPLAHMRRIATKDTVLNGQFIRKGDKVVMWYASANRDERTFENADDFVIDRPNARQHLSFGIGVHRCMGSRLAEMQLRILWEELLARFEDIEVLGEPGYLQSNFVRGYTEMMVTLTPIGRPPRSGARRRDRSAASRRAPAVTSVGEFTARVAGRREVADGIVELTLSDPAGATLPSWTAGAHVDLVLDNGLERQYSLCGSATDTSSWTVAVLREPNGRGGSAYVHDILVDGATVRVRGPRNNFRLLPSPRYLFIAGGIGITPILPMIDAAEAVGAEWSLLYGGRSRESMAFLDRLEGDPRVTVWPQDDKGLLDLASALGMPLPDTLVYACGPGALLDAVEERCAAWPDGSLHIERFAAKKVEPAEGALDSFEVECSRSGVTVSVPAGVSVFDAVERAGVDVLGSCMEGVCGTCEVDVLAGTPDHRDSILTASEHERGTTMMPCVSRSLSAKLILDM
ncbi:cytochrome [Rhodococcus sp. Leaf7]|uniref:cytochrome P450/oxidoreductase n=1 Tax=unclassified Rhodococcus (in: high G+C Gram-positive bacteria) TaxID=192944 RepID=UPI0006F39A8F|nr:MULTISPECIES: cytochrome P450/oxidoreductase [unclassified Rhodococcus (in: high G+C Gram-positive bacteria)]KQU04612.1 cytochrome [Rhodococcus sp. Leaf7]KQU40798.1 cytochrome [Rhodococcus sp. Leaf247]